MPSVPGRRRLSRKNKLRKFCRAGRFAADGPCALGRAVAPPARPVPRPGRTNSWGRRPNGEIVLAPRGILSLEWRQAARSGPPPLPNHPTTDWALRGSASPLPTTYQGVRTMTTPRRLRAAGATLALVAAATCSHVWGTPKDSPPRKPNLLAGAIRTPQDPGATPDDVTPGGRFAKQPVVTYQTLQGELHFALQLAPKLPAGSARPRDIAVVIDTSASQAGSPLR